MLLRVARLNMRLTILRCIWLNVQILLYVYVHLNFGWTQLGLLFVFWLNVNVLIYVHVTIQFCYIVI